MYEWLLSFLKYVLIFIQTMGVVYKLDGLKFGSAKLTMKRVNCFSHVSWLKFLVCTVLELHEYEDQTGIMLIFIGTRLYHPEWTGGGSCPLVRCQYLFLNLSPYEECCMHLKKVRILSH
jgi:hypothetical protein